MGDPIHYCENCSALFWFEERVNKRNVRGSPKYSTCCNQGKITLPPINQPPKQLLDLFFKFSEKRTHFLENIRSYNSMFCFTSMGGKIDNSINQGSAAPVFRMYGHNFHLIGSLLPPDGIKAKFAQLYIHDTENEINNRICSVRYVCLLHILYSYRPQSILFSLA